MKKSLIFFICVMTCMVDNSYAQETMFDLFKRSSKRGDQHYQKGNYRTALALYNNALKKDSSNREVLLKIARCYYYLKQYNKATFIYKSELARSASLLPLDCYYLAESFCGMANYDMAKKYYKIYLEKEPGDEIAMKKAWRIGNLQYLYSDSSHLTVRPLAFNTTYGELAPTQYKDGFVFLSNRKELKLIEHLDASSGSFYKVYYTSVSRDTLDSLHTTSPVPFPVIINSSLHNGPVAFYEDETKMVFVTERKKRGLRGRKTLQLYFAEQKEGKWIVSGSYPFNSNLYSITDPAISEDGTILYFSSDMPGGLGGKDLYKSVYANGIWSDPVNLGSKINTKYDEEFPFIAADNTFYFSSNGHDGFGGLDIFKAEILHDDFDEVENVGYPINTSEDEFAFTLDENGSHGYFSSNRKNGGYDDDIYEFKIDLQQYPVQISGQLQYKEHNWNTPSETKKLPNVKLYLQDVIRQTTVGETLSDTLGNFYLVIPHFSKYRIKVKVGNDDEYLVSLDVPKYETKLEDYDIVIVKDALKLNR